MRVKASLSSNSLIRMRAQAGPVDSESSRMSRDHDSSESRNSVAASRHHIVRVIISEAEGLATRERHVGISHSVTVSSMGIRLPFEILIAIVKEVDDVGDLRHLRLAGQTLCAAATPFAFRVLSAITTRESAENLGRLLDLPAIAAHVREVSYHDTGADGKGRELKHGTSTPLSSHKRRHEMSLCTCGGGLRQLELKSSTNWRVRFLAFTSCPGSRPST